MIPIVFGLGGLIARVAAAAVIPRIVKALSAGVSRPSAPKDLVQLELGRTEGRPIRSGPGTAPGLPVPAPALEREKLSFSACRHTRSNPISCVDPAGLDANLSMVVVQGGTYNALGHSWLEVDPIAGTGSNWSETTSYGSYPDGVHVNADLNSGYGPGTQRVRVTIRLNAEQEKAFLKWYKQAKKKKWTPEKNCGVFSINGWNFVAPPGNDINYGDAQERVGPDMVSDNRAKIYLRAQRALTGNYPLNVTPRQLGRHLNTLPGHTND